jgi:hypothetical protein
MSVAKFNADVASWGCLVKSWATSLDYIGSSNFSPTDFATQPPSASSAGKPWALPAMSPVDVPAESSGSVALPKAIALTRQQFLDRLSSAGVKDVFLPSQYYHVVVVQGSVDTMVVRLPPQDVLQGSENDIIGNGYVDPPSFYQDLYVQPGAVRVGPFLPAPTDRAGLMRLHASRIGDYTMSNCD